MKITKSYIRQAHKKTESDVKYTPAAQRVARVIGEDLLLAILAQASDKLWESDADEWSELVDVDASLEFNTADLFEGAIEDVRSDVADGSIVIKGDSGKQYESGVVERACTDILELKLEDLCSLITNNQPRRYNHIMDVVATAMDEAADMADDDDDW